MSKVRDLVRFTIVVCLTCVFIKIVHESAMKLQEGKTLFDERLVLAGDIKYPSLTFCPRIGNDWAFYKVIITCRKAISKSGEIALRFGDCSETGVFATGRLKRVIFS